MRPLPIKTKAKKHSKLEKELLEALFTMTQQADEDCPGENRTEHFDEALNDSIKILKREGIIN